MRPEYLADGVPKMAAELLTLRARCAALESERDEALAAIDFWAVTRDALRAWIDDKTEGPDDAKTTRFYEACATADQGLRAVLAKALSSPATATPDATACGVCGKPITEGQSRVMSLVPRPTHRVCPGLGAPATATPDAKGEGV